MGTRTLVILVATLSLAAAALVGAAADDAGVGVIRLPTDRGEGLAGNEVTMAAEAVAEAWEEVQKRGEEDAAPAATEKSVVFVVDEEETTRPWACCNQTQCTKSIPPTCHCLDVVDKCDGACKKCEPAIIYPFRLVCNDEFHGDPGPKCPGGDVVPSGASRSLAAAAAQLLLACVVLLFIQSQY